MKANAGQIGAEKLSLLWPRKPDARMFRKISAQCCSAAARRANDEEVRSNFTAWRQILCPKKIADYSDHPLYLRISKLRIYRERDDAPDQALCHRKASSRHANALRVALLKVNRYGVMYPAADAMTGQMFSQGVAFIAGNDIEMIHVRAFLARCWKDQW